MRWGVQLSIWGCAAALVAACLLAGCGEGETRDRDRPARAGHGKKQKRAERKERQRRDEERRRETERDRASDRSRPAAIPPGARRTTVTDVADGDTVHLAGLGSSRLIGIDTPEVYGGQECFGEEASAFTKRKLPPGTTVYFAHGTERTDRYGRDLVYVWLPSGAFFNAMLAKRGYAVPLTIPPNVEYADLFRRMAAAAREAGRGLWDPATCAGDPDQAAGGGSGGGSSGGGPGGGGSGGGSAAGVKTPPGGGCEPGYDPCVPTYPPDVDCADVGGPIAVSGSDPHGLDADRDGVGCE